MSLFIAIAHSAGPVLNFPVWVSVQLFGRVPQFRNAISLVSLFLIPIFTYVHSVMKERRRGKKKFPSFFLRLCHSWSADYLFSCRCPVEDQRDIRGTHLVERSQTEACRGWNGGRCLFCLFLIACYGQRYLLPFTLPLQHRLTKTRPWILSIPTKTDGQQEHYYYD
jgi:hypothetical protein